MFVITSVIAVIAVYFLGFASDLLENSLVKNKHTAYSIMKDDISDIEYYEILNNNGGIQVINSEYKIILSKGIDNFPKNELTASEFTEFISQSQAVNRKYSYSIAYNENKKFWLIVTFPTSIRIDFNITHNSLYRSADTGAVIWFILIIIIVYILLLTVSTIIYSRLTAVSFTRPLSILKKYTNKVKRGLFSKG